MTPTGDHPIFFSRIVSIIAMMVSSAVLFGWWLDIAALKSVFPGLVSMKANTAIGILLCGVALALLSWKRIGKPLRYLAAALALVVMALGALTLNEYLLGWDLGIDQWLFGEAQRAAGTSHPGRMSPASTLCFVFAGTALLVAALPIALRLRQATVAALGATVTLLGILALAGYLLEAGLSYHIWNYTGTAVHTAASFILLGCGLLALLRSEGGLVWSLNTMTTVGFIAAIALMITVAGVSYNFAKQQQQTAIWVSHSQEVLKAFQNMKSDLASLESSQRGYIIMGEESLRERFVQAKAQLPMSFDTLRNLTAGNANQQQRLDQLESLIARRVDFAEQTVAVRKQQGFTAAQQLVATGRGMALTDSLGPMLKEMQDEENALLDGRQKQSAAASVTTFLLLPLGAFLSLAMLSLGLFLLNTGVTEQAQTERAMEESEARLAGIVNSAMDAIISVSSEQKIILFNSAAEKIFRCPAAEALGQPIQTFIPQRFHQQHRQHIESFGQTGVTSRSMRSLGMLSGLRFDGEEFPLEASISQVEVAGQKIFTVILRDITERKQAETMLLASEVRYRRLFESAKDGILILDAETGMIVDVNPFLIEMLGFSHDVFLGKKIWELGFFKDIVANQANFAQLGEKEYIRYEDKPLETADGRRIEVEFVSNVYLVNHQKVIQCNIRNITDRKQAEEKIQRFNAELEQRVIERTTQLTAVNKELEAFSYSVSHDLRAPLRHINGFSQALLEDYADKLDEEGRGYLQEVRNATNDMAHLIDDVLQLARVTRSEMHREIVNLSETVLDVITELKKRDPQREVVIEVEEGLMAQGDKRLLQIMLSNLLENAWKFTAKRDPSEIVFGQQERNGEAVYFVRDNGAGFDMAYAGKLFGAFQRLHSVAEFEGTGIGLATVQRVILRHGGRVWAEAAVNEGATFYFTLGNVREE